MMIVEVMSFVHHVHVYMQSNTAIVFLVYFSLLLLFKISLAPILTGISFASLRFIILERYRGCCEASMKNTRHALSTLILNIAVAAHIGGSTAQEGKEHVLEVIAQLLTLIPGDDHESGFRVLVAGMIHYIFL